MRPRCISPGSGTRRGSAGCNTTHRSSSRWFATPAKRWLAPNPAGLRLLDLELIDIKHIGTDSAQAEGLMNRKVALPPNLGITSNEFGPALGALVSKAVNVWYDGQKPPLPPADRERM